MKNLIQYVFTLIFTLTITISMYGQNNLWETIAPDKEEFTLKVPTVNFSAYRFSYGKGKYNSGSYRAFSNGAYFLVSTANYADWDFLNAIKNHLRINNAKGKRVKFGKIKGKTYSFIDNDTYSNKIIIVTTQKRNYVFHIAALEPDISQIENFTSSISFLPKTKNGKTSIKKRFAKFDSATNLNLLSKKVSNSSEKTPNNSSRTKGVGIGSGSSSRRKIKPPKNIAQSKKNVIRTGIKILSKPKPGYTNLARIYNISGVVRVRVTFLASGKIGKISVIQGLPFGLIDKALNATRGLRFSPPTRNGKPYTVNKVVVYNFRVY